ncbi:MAG TPA: PP2C family protein-serine/threonine phosphatase [Thermoanaerobaculia bacterium]|nr:PP2C family protein-serine/threonine phosphatase [Thermoanaerobaculia bacterium]
MRNARSLFLWLVAGAAGLALLLWAYPRAFPFLPRTWDLSRDEAVDVALERLRDLGEPVDNAYVVARLDGDPFLERRLEQALAGRSLEDLRATGLADQVLAWQVIVYPRGALPQDWTYIAQIALSGDVIALRLRLDPQAKGKPISPEEARNRADAFLAAQGIDLSRYGEPELRSQQLAGRTDLTVRYRDQRVTPGQGSAHGLQVLFAGDRLTGFAPWLDDPRERDLQRTIQNLQFLGAARLVSVFLLAALLAVPFLKRYHEGEIGVRRGVQIFLLVGGAGLLTLLLAGRADSQQINFGFASREQTTWLYILFGMVFNGFPAALLAFFAWSVGESVCRERWGAKLAAFDALFKGDLANETVARSALRGWMAGLLAAGSVAALLLPLQRMGAWPVASQTLAASSRWPGLELAGVALSFSLPFYLAVVLCLLPLAVRRLGKVPGSLLTVLVAGCVIPPPALVVPLGWAFLVAVAFAAVPVLLFLFFDLLTVLTAGFVAQVLFAALPMVLANDTTVEVHGWIALGLLAVPLAASLRALGSGKEWIYSYEDVPPHVRRIAERERQRVELETARRIQSSILPDLPPRLAGVDIAHAYLPASEVGGDFYDVLALEDGRLAVAVGDVAGHGVSSGLIMSMAKSALAVQVTFDPDVAAVFNTLNRTVYQTARKRLLATLCYALLDPRRLELLYASAGHLFPYRITAGGKVEALESVAYPLGVRGELNVEARAVRLLPGDVLFLFSDGLVEARAEGSEDLFGFERLEASLAKNAGRGVERLRDGVLADVTRFTGHAPREDDQTILVLGLP